MLANHGSVLVISIVLVGLTALVTAGAIVAGDRPDSSLRVLCLTEAG